MSLHHIHVPQANMLVVDSKPLIETSLSVGETCNNKNVAARWVRTIKWNWQVTLCGLIKENSDNLYAYLACGV